MENIFQNKVVWVTGASSGIGQEIARQTAEMGAIVVLSSRKKNELDSLKLVLPNPEKHLVLPLDLEHSETFPEFARQIVAQAGSIDFLFNNGGISQRSTIEETSLDIDRKIMEINYFGNIALTKAVLPYMIAQKSGQIVVTSSIAGKFGFYLRSAYSASKHALFGFYECLMLEEAKNNIFVTIAVPGKINTNISLHALNGSGSEHGVMDHNQETGMPADVCVKQLLDAVVKKKKEVLIGNKELLAVKIKRFFPSLFWKIIKNQSAT